MRKLLITLAMCAGCGVEAELDVVTSDEARALRNTELVAEVEDVDFELAGAPLPEGCYHNYLGDSYNGYVCFQHADCAAACKQACGDAVPNRPGEGRRCAASDVKAAYLPST